MHYLGYNELNSIFSEDYTIGWAAHNLPPANRTFDELYQVLLCVGSEYKNSR